MKRIKIYNLWKKLARGSFFYFIPGVAYHYDRENKRTYIILSWIFWAIYILVKDHKLYYESHPIDVPNTQDSINKIIQKLNANQSFKNELQRIIQSRVNVQINKEKESFENDFKTFKEDHKKGYK